MCASYANAVISALEQQSSINNVKISYKRSNSMGPNAKLSYNFSVLLQLSTHQPTRIAPKVDRILFHTRIRARTLIGGICHFAFVQIRQSTLK